MDVSKAKVGDKTLVDAFYPAVSAIAETEGSIEALLDAAAELPKKGADATADMTAKFGRAEKTLANAASAIKTRAPYPWQFSLPGLPKAQEHSSFKKRRHF